MSEIVLRVRHERGRFVPATPEDRQTALDHDMRTEWHTWDGCKAACDIAGIVCRDLSVEPDDAKAAPTRDGYLPGVKIVKGKRHASSTFLVGKYPTREAWLLAGIELFRPWFKRVGAAVPDNVRASCGFALGSRKAIGQAWGAATCKDGSNAVFVSPVIEEPTRVLDILLHELCHTALPTGTGHKKPFAKLAGDLGLVKPWTATTASPDLRKELKKLSADLGPYPHAALGVIDRKKQGTRLLKAQCLTCGYTVRVTRKWVDDIGEPHCPLHGEMECL